MRKHRRKEATLCLLLFLTLVIVYRNVYRSISYNITGSSSISNEDIGNTIWWQSSPLWVEDQRPQVNPHKFGYLINQPELCNTPSPPPPPAMPDTEITLLVMVASAAGHLERRNAIRQTWAFSLTKVKVIFLLGQGHDQQTKIQSESDIYQDIIQEDFEDTYQNLTIKTVMGLKWMSIFCPKAKYVLKTDDDIFVNIPLLIEALEKETKNFSSHISGCVKNSPINSPLPIPKEGQHPHASMMRPALPEFTAGAGYLLPGNFVPNLYLASLSTKFIPVEDAFTTGYCAIKIGLHPPINDRRFSCGQLVTKDCDMIGRFTGHKVTPERMFSIYEQLKEKQTCE